MSAPEPISPLAEEIVLACRRMLSGQIGVLSAARQIKSLAFRLHGDKYVHDKFRIFIAIDSETDHLPVGPERRHWAPDALVRKDADIRDTRIPGARSPLRRLGRSLSLMSAQLPNQALHRMAAPRCGMAIRESAKGRHR